MKGSFWLTVAEGSIQHGGEGLLKSQWTGSRGRDGRPGVTFPGTLE